MENKIWKEIWTAGSFFYIASVAVAKKIFELGSIEPGMSESSQYLRFDADLQLPRPYNSTVIVHRLTAKSTPYLLDSKKHPRVLLFVNSALDFKVPGDPDLGPNWPMLEGDDVVFSLQAIPATEILAVVVTSTALAIELAALDHHVPVFDGDGTEHRS